MAYVINPDGTVSSVEVDYDETGKIREKKNYDKLDDYHLSVSHKTGNKSKGTSGSSPTLRYKFKQSPTNGVTQNSTNQIGASRENTEEVPPAPNLPAKKEKIIHPITKARINVYFARKKKQHRPISESDYHHAISILTGDLLEHYLQCYDRHQFLCKVYGWGTSEKNTKPLNLKTKTKKKKSECDNISATLVEMEITHNKIREGIKEIDKLTKQVKQKTKKKKNKQRISTSVHSESKHSGYSLADIATVSSLNGSSSGEDIVFGRSVFGASRQPKYGYARDRYGRIQERDKLDEERRNEIKQSQKRQSNYDFSSYDPEDDHDSYYDSPSYE